MKLDEGRIVYLNPRRGHDAVGGVQNAVATPQAQAITMSALKAFGVPEAEFDRNGLQVRWQNLRLMPGLSETDTLPRTAVVQSVADALALQNPCNSVQAIGARIAYVSANEFAFDSTPDSEDELRPDEDSDLAQPLTTDKAYVPALVVTVLPNEAREDSGELSAAGELIVVPLLAAPQDEP